LAPKYLSTLSPRRRHVKTPCGERGMGDGQMSAACNTSAIWRVSELTIHPALTWRRNRPISLASATVEAVDAVGFGGRNGDEFRPRVLHAVHAAMDLLKL